MPNLSLDVGDDAELAEILQFFCDWLAAEHGGLGASLQRYVGCPTCGITQLRADLDRFTFLLGGCRRRTPGRGQTDPVPRLSQPVYWPRLPLAHAAHNAVGDPGDRLLGDLGAVYLLQISSWLRPSDYHVPASVSHRCRLATTMGSKLESRSRSTLAVRAMTGIRQALLGAPDWSFDLSGT